jgi:hypothetical protein
MIKEGIKTEIVALKDGLNIYKGKTTGSQRVRRPPVKWVKSG